MWDFILKNKVHLWYSPLDSECRFKKPTNVIQSFPTSKISSQGLTHDSQTVIEEALGSHRCVKAGPRLLMDWGDISSKCRRHQANQMLHGYLLMFVPLWQRMDQVGVAEGKRKKRKTTIMVMSNTFSSLGKGSRGKAGMGRLGSWQREESYAGLLRILVNGS